MRFNRTSPGKAKPAPFPASPPGPEPAAGSGGRAGGSRPPPGLPCGCWAGGAGGTRGRAEPSRGGAERSGAAPPQRREEAARRAGLGEGLRGGASLAPFFSPQIFQWRQLENLYFREKKFSVEVHDPRR